MAPVSALAERGAAVPRRPAADIPVRAREGRRPLYLCARLKARVDADGPALRVRGAGRAEARYPLYRVSRVIAGNRIDWSASALQACLQAGIPIIIVGGSGAPLGSVRPALVAASRFSEDVEELLDRPDWREIYDNWRRAARMRLLADWRAERAAAGEPPAAGEFREMVRKFVYGGADSIRFEKGAELWRAATCALAAAVLRRMDLQSMYWGAGGTALDLLDDVARLLELKLRLEVQTRMEQALDGEALALRVFHSVSAKLEEQGGRILLSLARRLKQVLAEWR